MMRNLKNLAFSLSLALAFTFTLSSCGGGASSNPGEALADIACDCMGEMFGLMEEAKAGDADAIAKTQEMSADMEECMKKGESYVTELDKLPEEEQQEIAKSMLSRLQSQCPEIAEQIPGNALDAFK